MSEWVPIRASAPTPRGHYFDPFEDRVRIAGLFTIVEDARVAATVGREYGGIRPWLLSMQAYEAGQRRDVSELGLRAAYVENMRRASLGRPETIRYPADLMPLLHEVPDHLAAAVQRDATVHASSQASAPTYHHARILHPDTLALRPDRLNVPDLDHRGI